MPEDSRLSSGTSWEKGDHTNMMNHGQTNPVVAHKRSSQLSLSDPQGSTQPQTKKTKRPSSEPSLLGPETTTQGPPMTNKQYDHWTTQEHLLFLLGLEKCGEGKWVDIRKKFLPHKLPQQLTSHNQKFKLRLNVDAKRRAKRPSLLDVRAIDYSDPEHLDAIRMTTEQNPQPDQATTTLSSSHIPLEEQACTDLSYPEYLDQLVRTATVKRDLESGQSSTTLPSNDILLQEQAYTDDYSTLYNNQYYAEHNLDHLIHMPGRNSDLHQSTRTLSSNQPPFVTSFVTNDQPPFVQEYAWEEPCYMQNQPPRQKLIGMTYQELPPLRHQTFNPASYPWHKQPYITTNGPYNSTFHNQYYYGHQPYVEEPAKAVCNMQQQQPSYRAEFETHQPLEHQPAAYPESHSIHGQTHITREGSQLEGQYALTRDAYSINAPAFTSQVRTQSCLRNEPVESMRLILGQLRSEQSHQPNPESYQPHNH